MKKLAFLIGIFLSMSSYGNDNVVATIVNKSKLSVEEANQLYALEQKYAKMYDIPLNVGLAITYKESTFNVRAKNGVSYGLKQINYPIWYKQLKLQKNCLFDKECNIKNGYIILNYYVKTNNGNLNEAIMDYRGSTNKSINHRYMKDIIHKSMMFG